MYRIKWRRLIKCAMINDFDYPDEANHRKNLKFQITSSKKIIQIIKEYKNQRRIGTFSFFLLLLSSFFWFLLFGSWNLF